MHGQKRAEYKHRLADPPLAASLSQKAQQWYALTDKSLQLRQEPKSSSSASGEITLPLLDKMLRVNPDPLHLWNHRRVVLSSEMDWELTPELTLTAAALERNPKAYGAWFHRKWALQQSSETSSEVLKAELILTKQFLQRDERNFHCWNFRRFLVGLELGGGGGDGAWKTDDKAEEAVVVGPQIATTTSFKDSSSADTDTTSTILQREYDFTQRKIVQNFSNFSAFHYRTKLLALVDLEGGWTPFESLQEFATNEWSLMENIIFTEPDDQTVWWYHRFVLDWIQEQKPQDEWYSNWLQTQAEALQMLVEDEPECKWALLGYHLVLSRQQQVGKDCLSEMDALLDRLCQVDPDRAQRYQTLRRSS